MSSGTPTQRLLAIANLFAANLQSVKTTGQGQVAANQNGTPQTVAYTGDVSPTTEDDYQENTSYGVRRKYLQQQKALFNADATHSARRLTGRGCR